MSVIVDKDESAQFAKLIRCNGLGQNIRNLFCNIDILEIDRLSNDLISRVVKFNVDMFSAGMKFEI
jgi:hypothetical protein